MDHKTRDILLVLVLILAMVGLLVWYLLGRPKAALPVGSAATSTQQASIPASSAHDVPQHLTESAQYDEADLEYPSVTPLAQTAGAAADAAAIATMKTYNENSLATFKKDSGVADITPQVAEDEGLGGENKFDLSSTYQVYTSQSTVSYVFTISEDTLGAHPNSYFKTFTFDAKTGANLQLSDLFNSGVNYLDPLSTITRSALTTQQGSDADPTFINPGTTPVATNFQNFAIDGSNLVIYFPPYQAAPYSSGPQIVHIPLSQLVGVLKSTYE
jgi:hypothetical protein